MLKTDNRPVCRVVVWILIALLVLVVSATASCKISNSYCALSVLRLTMASRSEESREKNISSELQANCRQLEEIVSQLARSVETLPSSRGEPGPSSESQRHSIGTENLPASREEPGPSDLGNHIRSDTLGNLAAPKNEPQPSSGRRQQQGALNPRSLMSELSEIFRPGRNRSRLRTVTGGRGSIRTAAGCRSQLATHGSSRYGNLLLRMHRVTIS